MFRAAHGLESVRKLRRGEVSSATHASDRELEAWRAAARRVWMRWDALLASQPEGRGRAFEAYAAALDAEAQAADEIAARAGAAA